MLCSSTATLENRPRIMPAPRLVKGIANAAMSPIHRILVIEDHVNLANLVRMHLECEGFDVVVAHDGNSGYLQAAAEPFDLVILDVSLPGIDGLTICHKLRARGITSGILILSALHTEADRVAGLDAGADDYVSKPFGVSELLARVRAQLRRGDRTPGGKADAESGAIVSYGDILIEEDSRSVTLAGKPVTLTAKEFDLLWLLARHPGRVFTRSQLLERVWSQDYAGLDNTVKSHINRLRSKIEPDPSHPIYVLTAWGVGYCFGPERRG